MMWVSDHNPDWDLVSLPSYSTCRFLRIASGLRIVSLWIGRTMSRRKAPSSWKPPQRKRIRSESPKTSRRYFIDWIKPYIKKSGTAFPAGKARLNGAGRIFLIPAITENTTRLCLA